MRISVVTPTIPPREKILRECILSVGAQTLDASEYEHLIGLDEAYAGCAVTVNRLVSKAQGEYLLVFPDDDILFPAALETLLEHAHEGDVVYSPPLVRGNNGTHFYGTPPGIPSFGLMRTELFRSLGGYDETTKREEDRKLWTKVLEAGGTFVRIDWPLWVYGFNFAEDGKPRNKSYARGVSS